MKRKALTFFLAGIIQGSLPSKKIYSQSYRESIKSELKAKYPQSVIIDPLELHPQAVSYGPIRARRTFFHHLQAASSADVLICYLPQASMGTAIEMYEAYKRGRVIISITPLKFNWAIRFLSDSLLPDLKAFARFVQRGGIARIIRYKRAYAKEST